MGYGSLSGGILGLRPNERIGESRPIRISIVSISYNQARFLRECIDSVLSQDYEDVEYIVVDAGSTDGSREVIESYGERIIKVFEVDDGPADGLNKGFSLATGEVFGFVNSDDKLLPGALSCVARSFKSRPGVDVISGCGYFIDASGRRRERIVPSKFTPWLHAHSAVTVFQQGTFFRRISFQLVNGFNPANAIAWDGELFLDMALSGARFDRISEDLALFRVHANSITGSGGHDSSDERYRAYRARVFEKATGRKRRKADWVTDRVARLIKWTSSPVSFVNRARAGTTGARM